MGRIMWDSRQIVVGIDVGGDRKGFHAVALSDGQLVDRKAGRNPAEMVDWCIYQKAKVIAIDAPCRWSKSGLSRLVERELGKDGIRCFATPSRDRALENNFYKWVLNGERLYQGLADQYPLFIGERSDGQMCIETFPHAVVCAIAGRVIPARPKSTVRRGVLQGKGYDDSGLTNIDFVDAALCAVAADEFRKGCFQVYGDVSEGFIVVPVSSMSATNAYHWL